MLKEASGLSPLMPDRDPRDKKLVNTSVTIPEWIRDRVTELSERKGYSRSEALTELLKFGLAHLDAVESRQGASLFEAIVRSQEAAAEVAAAYEREKKNRK